MKLRNLFKKKSRTGLYGVVNKFGEDQVPPEKDFRKMLDEYNRLKTGDGELALVRHDDVHGYTVLQAG